MAAGDCANCANCAEDTRKEGESPQRACDKLKAQKQDRERCFSEIDFYCVFRIAASLVSVAQSMIDQ